MLSVRDITLERHFRPVFRALSFELAAGQVLLVTGDNGSGKTTLLRLLAGLLRPSQGALERHANSMMYVGHLLAVKDDLDVFENIEFMGRLFGRSELSTDEIIEWVGLRAVATQAARTLSAGQRKRCALARLLLKPSDLWLLDEPYSNLDQQGTELVDGLLRDHLQRGGACVLATHGQLKPRNLEFEVLALQKGQAL